MLLKLANYHQNKIIRHPNFTELQKLKLFLNKYKKYHRKEKLKKNYIYNFSDSLD